MTDSPLSRRSFLVGASLGVTAALAAGCRPATEVQRPARAPNIVLIMADDLGTGDLGSYGQRQIATPNLDRMARDGMRFTNAYSGHSVCRPSRCSLMTGYHTGHTYIRDNRMEYPLRSTDVTVAAVLKDAGYATGMFGKWALGSAGTTGVPWEHGFDEFWGWLDQTRAHNYYPDYLDHNDEQVPLAGNEGTGTAVYAPDYLLDRTLEFVRDHADEPFFLYVPYTLPHSGHTGNPDDSFMVIPSLGQYADKNWPEAARGYAAMVSLIDDQVGRLLALLDELNLSEDTIVFFTADNGAGKGGGYDPPMLDSNGPFTGRKRTLNEGGIRVPALARWTGTIAPRTVSSYAWAGWDFLPTAADLAGVSPPAGLDGLSIVPTLLGQRQEPHQFLYWETDEVDAEAATITLDQQALRVDSWKMIIPEVGAEPELYNLAADRAENSNVASRHPDVIERLTALLDGIRTEPEIIQEDLVA